MVRIGLAGILLGLVALLGLWSRGNASWLVSSDENSLQKSTVAPTAFECRFTETPPKIDGNPNDECWKQAQEISCFRKHWKQGEEQTPKSKTKAKLLWDREYIYFLAEMEDEDLFADITEHDGNTWFNDVFELFLKPDEKKPGYYEFQVNAANTIFDCYFPERGKGNFDQIKKADTFHIDAKVKLDGTLNKRDDKDKGWVVEGRIPWSDFAKSGGRPEVNAIWKTNLSRYDYNIHWKEPDTSSAAPLTKPDFHRYEDFADLKFTGPAKADGPKRVAGTTSKVTGFPEPPPPYRIKRVHPGVTLEYPIAVVNQPKTDLLWVITEESRYGPTKVVRLKDQPDVKDFQVLLTDIGVAYNICFHPKFLENGYVYLGHNIGTPKGNATRITRYTVDLKEPNKVDPASAKIIIEALCDGHNGGAICFGNDGMMYVTFGDGTADSDRNLKGQDMTSLLAKVLRLDVDHPDEGKPYSVPKDNPFVGQKDIVPETWAYGMRNPWRMTCDPVTGHIWVGQNGQDLWEQVYLIHKGDNCGWSIQEGSHPFYPDRKRGPTPIVNPTFEHSHAESRSLTGGLVYYGKKFPELRGAYIYGDYSTGRIWAGKHDGTKVLWHKLLAVTPMLITYFGLDKDGEILICDHQPPGQGGFYTLESTPSDDSYLRFPKKLSETGLFKDIKTHTLQPSVYPYSINAPFWSDGSAKSRFFYLPGDTQIDYKSKDGWEFPDDAVTIKSFSLETAQGKKWIETRLMSRQMGQWYGYSYIWNPEQTDADLVEATGRDVKYNLADGSTQVWHYPSRADCLVCHSRAANFVLGLSELQANKGDQLRQFESLGLLKTGLLPNPPEKLKKLVDPFDPKQDLNLRARAWLHSNCASCHVEAGGGNAQFDAHFETEVQKMKLMNVAPMHHKFGVEDAKLIYPGEPDKSVILKRIEQRKEGFMPPLGSVKTDERAVELIREWIKSLK
ncbi:PQQ-dependent sugar dehydrogenase [Telmatocola sphagniphila]|uniref:PQQ-dependent sugar dehydrogenase n=1 Tax=Telmatocola sphagniphila TaxID=1123043 RepID=A0A8E6B2W3_9BACT|nr:PQQ-dependent sugar dehydrogenase [Telmatocola sphagniphila]QVL30928.1 PQQ-dependent sugar dehydrogenase [Telmatocola sphagniphila]